MKKKISYSDSPMEEVKVVKDFLPPPEDLAFREETAEATTILNTLRRPLTGGLEEDDGRRHGRVQ
jgi:hypothetical protein